MIRSASLHSLRRRLRQSHDLRQLYAEYMA
jgi:hypothetical protein